MMPCRQFADLGGEGPLFLGRELASRVLSFLRKLRDGHETSEFEQCANSSLDKKIQRARYKGACERFGMASVSLLSFRGPYSLIEIVVG